MARFGHGQVTKTHFCGSVSVCRLAGNMLRDETLQELLADHSIIGTVVLFYSRSLFMFLAGFVQSTIEDKSSSAKRFEDDFILPKATGKTSLCAGLTSSLHNS